ncbi:FAD-binding oxidoreductase [Zhihengliuella sp.]|uniref:NAD(P)/FAD-dependent oxidoreductase n=1 Tax=Zhihengliuella sp. TaxID=1954483 RepID=UPI002811A216|nr:FAD-binding oxidoreductase [Zhihengliuella sp.]
MSRIAVVGAGIIGLATAWTLRRRGADVVLYESGTPGGGQSAGESRIFRHAHDDARLAAFVSRSRALWREWDQAFGRTLISGAGAIALGEAIEDKLRILERVPGVPTRRLDPQELSELLPLLAEYTGPAMLDVDGGTIHTLSAFDALTGALADALVRDHVLSVRHAGAGAEVRTGTGVDTFDHVVLCAGRDTAWLAHGAGLEVPVELSAHVRVTFGVREPAETPLPTLQDSSGAFGEASIYAAPTEDNRRYSVGVSGSNPAATDGSLTDPSELERLAARAAAYVSRALPGLDPEPLEYVHCWVTKAPWGEDGVGIWSTGRISAAAGHNLFKQAPALGEALAETALTGVVPELLRPESRLGAA